MFRPKYGNYVLANDVWATGRANSGLTCVTDCTFGEYNVADTAGRADTVHIYNIQCEHDANLDISVITTRKPD